MCMRVGKWEDKENLVFFYHIENQSQISGCQGQPFIIVHNSVYWLRLAVGFFS